VSRKFNLREFRFVVCYVSQKGEYKRRRRRRRGGGGGGGGGGRINVRRGIKKRRDV
jgi:hypothetical protein